MGSNLPGVGFFFFFFAAFPPIYTKTHTNFVYFSDLVTCVFLVWSDYVRAAAAWVIMYRFTAIHLCTVQQYY